MTPQIHYLVGKKHPTSKQRFDIGKKKGYYPHFENLLRVKRGDNVGGLSFNFGERPGTFKNRHERATDKAITRGKSISSVYEPDPYINIGYGDINNTDDSLIIRWNKDMSIVELFIFIGQKANKLNIYQMFMDKHFEAEIEVIIANSEEVNVGIDYNKKPNKPTQLTMLF